MNNNLNHCYIIAEAGVNHNGSLSKALELVDAAAQAGADAVKFQTFNVDSLVTKDVESTKYQVQNTGSQQTQHALLKKLSLSQSEHIEIRKYCHQKDITFLSTGFDCESIQFLNEIGMPLFKISSGELTNLPLIRQVAGLNKPIILSTGMASLEEISATIQQLIQAGSKKSHITILHCTTEYPTPMEHVNLLFLETMQTHFPEITIGYSDHTLGIEVPIAAVALGAKVIEKHITLNRNLPGPDHAASIEPQELKSMVRAIRNIEVALGSRDKVLSEAEIENKSLVRKAIVAAKTIQKGELFTNENLTVKRAKGGQSPMNWDSILGKPASQLFLKDQTIHE